MRKFKLPILLPLVLCFVSFAKAQTYTRANLWQKEIDAFVETDRRQTPPKDAVLFVGSSSFRMWQNLRNDFSGFNVINRGFGGSEIEDSIYYAPQIILPYNPKTIFIYAGDNDIASGKSVGRVFADYQTLVGIIHKSFPKTRIVYVAIKPSPARRQFWEQFKLMNLFVRAATVRDKRLFFANIWTPMLTASGEPREELYLPDRLHMKPEGYAIWREVLSKYLK